VRSQFIRLVAGINNGKSIELQIGQRDTHRRSERGRRKQLGITADAEQRAARVNDFQRAGSDN
jgi:hypothetical protein